MCVWEKFSDAYVRVFFNSAYFLIGEKNLAHSFYLHLRMRFEKAEYNTCGALRPLTTLCPLYGYSERSLSLANLSLLALGKHRACGWCWRWHPKEWGQGFDYPGVINYHQLVSIYWTAFASQNTCESANQKKFWTDGVRSRYEDCCIQNLFGGCYKICSPLFLVPPAGNSLLACFPSNTMTKSQGKKEAELHLELLSFEILDVSASIYSQGHIWRQGGERGQWTLPFSVSHLVFPSPWRF